MYICEKCKLGFKNKGGCVSHISSCNLNESDVLKIKNDYIIDELSIRDIKRKYNLSTSIIYRLVGVENIRSLSESIRISHIKYPEKYKHTDISKQKLRESRLKWMKDNPDKTAWRQSNLSYPEKIFLEKILDIKWNEKYLIIREMSFFPYFADFAFLNEKIVVEIDGSQHELKERRERDIKKDELINSKGWTVIRFSASKIIKDIDECLNILSEYLKKSDGDVGVYLHKDFVNKIKLKEVDEFGFTKKEKESQLSQRRVVRPSYKELIELQKTISNKKIGMKYGVSEASIRKWIKMYEKYGTEY
jgi:very-short-patch-repair endonuclease/Trp operon repressor